MFIDKLHILLIVLFVSSLSSCVPSSFVYETDTHLSTKSNSDAFSSNPTAGQTMNATPSIPSGSMMTTSPIGTSTSASLPTLLPPEPTSLLLMCEKAELESVENYVNGLSGIFAYIVPVDANWERGDGQSGIVGGTPLQSHLFPPVNNINVIGFSPNDNWFAYTKPLDQPGRSEPFVYLLSDQGQTKIIPLPTKSEDETLFWFMTWISNNLMLIQYNSIPTGGGSGTYTVDSYAVIDAFTGEEHNELLGKLSHWDRWTTPYFSPDMTRAVYVTDSRSPFGTSLVLWDTQNQTILWSKPFRSAFGVEEDYIGNQGFNQSAFWAPDNSKFVFTTGETTSENETKYSSYLVDRDGISEHLLVSSPNFSDVMVLGGTWSPDGRFIYYFHGDSFVYDLALNQRIELCANYSTYVAWSPDSTELAYVSKVNQELYLLLFNIYTGEVSSIGELEDIVGLEWVANEKWLTISP